MIIKNNIHLKVCHGKTGLRRNFKKPLHFVKILLKWMEGSNVY